MEKRLIDLRKEEKELEEKVFGAQSTDVTTEEDSTGTEEKEEVPQKEDELVAQKPNATSAGTERTTIETEDWEKRYKNLRSSRDENLYKAKAQLALSLETIQNLQARIRELEQKVPTVDPLEGVFTAEDTDALGDTTVEALRKATKKATEAATNPLKKQLEDERKLREAQQKQYLEETKQQAYNIFLSRIAQAVPDWEAINYDPGFEKYMNEPDFDGTIRKTYFAEAEASGNAALIIRYMNEYKTSKGVKVDKLASKVTPVGDGSASPSVKEKSVEKISKQYIDKFYDDLSRGRYVGRATEAKAIEAKIDKAVMENRVVY